MIAVDQPHENQHHVSRVLLKRFKLPNQPFQCYQVESGEWVARSLDRACAAPGYNQLILPSEVENSIETEISKVESHLPKTFRALEAITSGKSSDMPPLEFENLCRYCTILKLTSLFSKATAVVNFVMELNSALEHDNISHLRSLKIPEIGINELRQSYALGQKVIVEGQNLPQVTYRLRFQNFPLFVQEFYHTQWSVLESPMELPFPDVGLFPLTLHDLKANRFILPISPFLILEGIFYHDQSKNRPHGPIKCKTLSNSDVQCYFDYLCASAINELICSKKLDGIPEAIQRCAENGIAFQRPTRRSLDLMAGTKNSDLGFKLQIVNADEYKAFIQSYLSPSP